MDFTLDELLAMTVDERVNAFFNTIEVMNPEEKASFVEQLKEAGGTFAELGKAIAGEGGA